MCGPASDSLGSTHRTARQGRSTSVVRIKARPELYYPDGKVFRESKSARGRVVDFRYPNTLPKGYRFFRHRARLAVKIQMHVLNFQDSNGFGKRKEHRRKGYQMMQGHVAKLARQLPEAGDAEGASAGATFPLRARLRYSKLSGPICLVASSNEEVLTKLAKILSQCGLATFLASGIEESRKVLVRERVFLVLCDERLVDGDYEDILSASEWSRSKAPVIVFSSTGDWPDYLKAIRAGAFDYMAYPPFPEELQRVIRNALESRMANTVRAITSTNSALDEEKYNE